MNANSTFQIGKDHTVCEDYALSGIKGDLAYAIVCDGCSASPDVDFGARCLAMSAKRELRLNDDVLAFDGKKAIANAERIIEVFPYISPSFLDATLLVACLNKKHLTLYMYGDGVMVHRSKDRLVSAHVQLPSGAPDYLSYHLDPLRKESYLKMEDNEKKITLRENDTESTRTYEPFNPFIYDCQVSDGDTISVISDGINSFRRADNTAVDWRELVNEFTGFKNFEGEFVLRRISAFKRKFTKENWHHFDDISIASIVV